MWSRIQIHIAHSIYKYRPIYTSIYKTRAQIYVILMSKAEICSWHCSFYWKFLGKYSKDKLNFAFALELQKKEQSEMKENNIYADFYTLRPKQIAQKEFTDLHSLHSPHKSVTKYLIASFKRRIKDITFSF